MLFVTKWQSQSVRLSVWICIESERMQWSFRMQYSVQTLMGGQHYSGFLFILFYLGIIQFPCGWPCHSIVSENLMFPMWINVILNKCPRKARVLCCTYLWMNWWQFNLALDCYDSREAQHSIAFPGIPGFFPQHLLWKDVIGKEFVKTPWKSKTGQMLNMHCH